MEREAAQMQLQRNPVGFAEIEDIQITLGPDFILTASILINN